MSYQAIYRRYRPKTFEEVIGEEHITATLKNQVKSGRINHAYLFSGPRGIGKTSCAKILARAVNCLAPNEGSPCNKCEMCMEIDSGFDVIEIDAASNNRVDEIRDLREKVKYAPAMARYKVYIIDEVHMLTDSAYNALLKTLEEPPSHVIFILATTEAHKLPKTILSRCLRFDFRLVGEDALTALVKRIYADIGRDAEDDALRLIASGGEGSVRDTLSIADVCASGTAGTITYQDVIKITGSTDRRAVLALAACAVSGNIDGVFAGTRGLLEAGANFSTLAKDLVAVLREMLIVKTCASYKVILRQSDSWIKQLEESAKACEVSRIVTLMSSLIDAEGSLRYSVNPAAILESAILKSINSVLTSIDLEKRVAKIEEILIKGGLSGANVWGEVVAALQKKDDIMLYSACSGLLGARIEDGKLIVPAKAATLEVLQRSSSVQIIEGILITLGYRLKFAAEQATEDTTHEDIERIKERLRGGTKLIIK